MRNNQSIQQRLTAQKGVQAIEFALMLPILIMLLFGVTEFGRYIIASQKANKLAQTVANLAAQLNALDCVGDQDVKSPPVTFNTLYPFEYKPQDGIVISAINNINGVSRIVFQSRTGTQGAGVPRIGTQGAAPNFALFGGYQLQNNEGVIVVEVTYLYEPILLPGGFLDVILGNIETWHFGLWRPRGGALVRLNPANLTTCP